MIKYKFIINKLSFYLIFFVITACAVNDKEAFNIIDEAKKIFLDFPKDEENISTFNCLFLRSKS